MMFLRLEHSHMPESRSHSDTPIGHYNTLQHTTTHCNTLQHTATHCNTLTLTPLSVWLYLLWPIHCDIYECIIEIPIWMRYLKVNDRNTTHCNTLQHTATHWLWHPRRDRQILGNHPPDQEGTWEYQRFSFFSPVQHVTPEAGGRP